MKSKFLLLLLLVPMGAPRLVAQATAGTGKPVPKDVPDQAKELLKKAWASDDAGKCIKALRLLVTNSAHPGAPMETTEEARTDALGALKDAEVNGAKVFPDDLLNEAFRNSKFRDWLGGTTIADRTAVQTEQDSKDLVDWIYDQDGGITKLGDVTRVRAAHPDSKDLVPLLSLLDAVPLSSGKLTPTSPDPTATCPDSKSHDPICKQSYVNKLDVFRAAYALKSANWSIFDYIAEKINGSPSK
jgi:hypothetical protein